MNAISANNFKKFIKGKPKTNIKLKLLECYYDLASTFLKKAATELPPYRPRVDYKVNLKDN